MMHTGCVTRTARGHRQAIGAAQSMVVGLHSCDMVQRYLAQPLKQPRVLHREEAAVNEQVPPVIGRPDCAAYHLTYS